jgi:hypothetical protein
LPAVAQLVPDSIFAERLKARQLSPEQIVQAHAVYYELIKTQQLDPEAVWRALDEVVTGQPLYDGSPATAIREAERILAGMNSVADDSSEGEAGEDEQPGQKGPSQGTRLVKLALEAGMEFFHDDRRLYVGLKVGKHKETWPLRSVSFRDLLSHLYYQRYGKSPGGTALEDAIKTLSGKAQFQGKWEEVFVRVAGDDTRILIDLANDEWEAIQITPEGWKVISDPGVRFRRTKGMSPLPTPIRGGSPSDLYPLPQHEDSRGSAPHSLVARDGVQTPWPLPRSMFGGRTREHKIDGCTALALACRSQRRRSAIITADSRGVFHFGVQLMVFEYRQLVGAEGLAFRFDLPRGERRRICEAHALHGQRRGNLPGSAAGDP